MFCTCLFFLRWKQSCRACEEENGVCVYVCMCFHRGPSQVKAEALTHVNQLQDLMLQTLWPSVVLKCSLMKKSSHPCTARMPCQCKHNIKLAPGLTIFYIVEFRQWDKALGSAGEVWDFAGCMLKWCYMFKTHHLFQRVRSPVNSVLPVSRVTLTWTAAEDAPK